VSFHRILAAASFLFVLTSGNAQKLLTSRTFGGSGSDSPAALAADAQGDIYVAGTTMSADLPASHGFQPKPAVLPLSISTDGAATFTGVTIPGVSEIDALATTVDGKIADADTPSGLFRSNNGGVSWSAMKPGIPVSAEVLTISLPIPTWFTRARSRDSTGTPTAAQLDSHRQRRAGFGPREPAREQQQPRCTSGCECRW
jgi:hypothetical protein